MQMPQIGDEVKLLISTVVKEDSITLYGFLDDSQQSMFELLLTVSGVGPKVALSILSFPGVGTKTAQRIVLELREKITSLVWAQAARKTAAPEQQVLVDAIEGLVALGYNRNDARSAAEAALKSARDKKDTAAIVTSALKSLSKG